MLERIMDIAADELGIDPVELRRRNFLQPDEFPYTTLIGAHYDSGDYELALDEAVRVAGYDELRAEQADAARARRPHAARHRRRVLRRGHRRRDGTEYGAVEVHDDGTATIAVGTSAHGQGHATSFAMIVSDRLGIPLDRIKFVQSDTALVPRGGGTGGSRSLQLGGVGGQQGGRRGAGAGPRGRRPAARGRPRRHRGHRRRPPRRGRRARRRHRRGPRSPPPRPTTASRCSPRSTSSRTARRSRSAPTSRWSRSTPTPVTSSWCATSPSTTAAASSTRCS